MKSFVEKLNFDKTDKNAEIIPLCTILKISHSFEPQSLIVYLIYYWYLKEIFSDMCEWYKIEIWILDWIQILSYLTESKKSVKSKI